jgi:2-polyprenyl-3-methyl-5-hydroxy-6-metoxy-1,4-benzoquinol methylase
MPNYQLISPTDGDLGAAALLGWRLSVTEQPVDQQYYREVQGGVARELFVAARQRIFRDFVARMRPTLADQILDVGVSDVIGDGANILEQSYSNPANITACGLSSGLTFKAAFPSVHYTKIEPNVRLPFDDGSFDIATSNAVLEHVGSFENQLSFVQELCRVAQRVFISVPNRFFPVEHHTAIPLAHYRDDTFKLACQFTNKIEWTDEKNLIFITRKRLWRLAAPVTRSAAVGYTGLRLGPFSSNLYLALH